MGIPVPTPTSGASMFGATGQFIQMPDNSLINLNVAQRIYQSGSSLIVELPTGNKLTLPYVSAAVASAALTGFADFLTAQFALLTLRSITPNTGGGATTINAVLLGTGFQYDILSGSFLAAIDIGGNPVSSATYVNSNTVLIQFVAPPAGTYDVNYTPVAGSKVTITNGWNST